MKFQFSQKEQSKVCKKDESEIYKERKHRYMVRTNFFMYCKVFQEYDMNKDREIGEIKSIIEVIPHNVSFTRNGIVFVGSFDYLNERKSINTLIDAIDLLELENHQEKLSLNKFINLAFENNHYY